jgi:hypothetical protein
MTIRRLGTPEQEAAGKERLRALVRECQKCGRLNFWGTFPCGHVVGAMEEFTEWFCGEIRTWPEWEKKVLREGVVPDRSGRIQ